MAGIPKKPFNYYVVEFRTVGRPAKERLMDVVCGSWLTKNVVQGGTHVLYPENFEDKDVLRDFKRRLRRLLPADNTWQKYRVKLRGKDRKF